MSVGGRACMRMRCMDSVCACGTMQDREMCMSWRMSVRSQLCVSYVSSETVRKKIASTPSSGSVRVSRARGGQSVCVRQERERAGT